MLKGIYLTLLVGPEVPVPVPSPVMEVLTSVQITSAAGQRSGFQLTFTFSNRSLLYPLFLLGAVETPKLRVILVVTVNGMPDVLMDGVIGRSELSPASEPGQSTLTISGEDLSVLMNLEDHDGTQFPGMTPELRVAEILADYADRGLVPEVIPSPFTDFPNPTEEIPEQQGTDLEYINQLADDVGYVFFIEPGPAPGLSKAYWGPDVKTGVPQPALNVALDAYTNVESLNFNLNTQDRTLPVVFIKVPDSSEFIQVPVPDISPINPPLGAIPLLPQRIERLEDTAQLSAAQAAGRALALASRTADAVGGSGTLDVVRYGRVLKARQLVGVRGAGIAFDGLYYVTSVTSTIQKGQFKQSFNLARNAIVSLTPTVPP
jgi:hypothetical protein